MVARRNSFFHYENSTFVLSERRGAPHRHGLLERSAGHVVHHDNRGDGAAGSGAGLDHDDADDAGRAVTDLDFAAGSFATSEAPFFCRENFDRINGIKRIFRKTLSQSC
jgi:hypothetical protein